MTDTATPVLRVCLIAPHFAEYSFALAEATAKHSQVLVIANLDNTINEIGEEFIDLGCNGLRTHFFHRTRNPISVVAQAASLVRAVRKFAPDVVHVQEDSKDVLALALPFLGKTPLLLTMHDPKPHSGDDDRVRQKTRHGRYIHQLRRRANAVLVHGESLVADARTAIGRNDVPVHVVPHGPLGQALSITGGAQRRPGRCLFFGRIEAYKGLSKFIDVVQHLRGIGVDVVGVVAGRGTDLDRHRARLVAPSFELIEKFLSPQEVVREFQLADVVLMPYENATQSGVAAYAIGVGRPCVAFDVGALKEIIHDGATGLMVPPGDVGAMAKAVSRLVEDRPFNQQLSANAAALGNGMLSWREIAGKSMAIYFGLAGKSQPPDTRGYPPRPASERLESKITSHRSSKVRND